MRRASVLVGSTDNDTLEMLQMLLEGEMAIQAVPCRNEGEVMQRVREAKPALVVLDVAPTHLLACLGIIRELKGDPQSRGIPLVVMSGIAETCRKAVQAGGDDCIIKPFELDALFDVIRKHLPT